MRRWFLAAAGLGLACTGGKPRPVAPSAEEVVSARPAVVHAAALSAITDLGLPLRFMDPAGGIIETDYFDILGFRPDATQYSPPERLVRFRIVVMAHESSPASRFAVYGLYAPFRTGLSNVRRGERAIPRDHPAMDLVRRMVQSVQKSAGGG